MAHLRASFESARVAQLRDHLAQLWSARDDGRFWRDRRVLAIIGDGSAMYSIQALWTAAHHKLPITYLISNNGGYRIIKERLKSFHGNENFVGMNFQDPSVDYTALARSLGMTAERVEDPGDVQRALQASYEREGPTLLEVMTKRGIG